MCTLQCDDLYRGYMRGVPNICLTRVRAFSLGALVICWSFCVRARLSDSVIRNGFDIDGQVVKKKCNSHNAPHIRF